MCKPSNQIWADSTTCVKPWEINIKKETTKFTSTNLSSHFKFQMLSIPCYSFPVTKSSYNSQRVRPPSKSKDIARESVRESQVVSHYLWILKWAITKPLKISPTTKQECHCPWKLTELMPNRILYSHFTSRILNSNPTTFRLPIFVA